MTAKSKVLSFTNSNGKIVYNPSIPFEHKGKIYMCVRIESFESELDSQTFFAYEIDKNANLWSIDYSLESLPLQDPSYIKINGETLILGVRVWQKDGKIKWKQDIYRGNSINNLEYFTSGPIGMKDIRLVDLEDRIGVFTRMRGRVWSRGKIGYFEVKNVDELGALTKKKWCSAKIINDLFGNTEWGGVNQAIKLPGGEIGVIGHIAHQTINNKSELEKHYRGMCFRFNPKTNTHSELRIIATRADFPRTSSKRSPELNDVIFSGGIDIENNFYCGLSDFCVAKKKIENLF